MWVNHSTKTIFHDYDIAIEELKDELIDDEDFQDVFIRCWGNKLTHSVISGSKQEQDEVVEKIKSDILAYWKEFLADNLEEVDEEETKALLNGSYDFGDYPKEG